MCCWWQSHTLFSLSRSHWPRLPTLTGNLAMTSTSSQRSQLRGAGRKEFLFTTAHRRLIFASYSSLNGISVEMFGETISITVIALTIIISIHSCWWTYWCGLGWCVAVAGSRRPGWPRADRRTRMTPQTRTPGADRLRTHADCLCSRCPVGSRPWENRKPRIWVNSVP